MKTPNRDLLVLVKDDLSNKLSIENEIEQLNEILFRTETIENFCIASEVFDMNRFRIIESHKELARVFSQRTLKPFQFICNMN